MSLATDPFTNTELAAVIPEVWTPIVNQEFFAKTVFANFCTDLSPFMEEGADIAHVPGVYTNSFTPKTQSTQGAEVDTEAVSMDDDTLTVDTHKYIAILIGDKDMHQIATKYDISMEWAVKMTKTLADALEDDLAGLWSSVSTNTVGDTATVLSDAEIRQSIEKLASTDFPEDELAFFIHPYVFWNQLHAITKYYQQDSIGPGDVSGPVANGHIGGGPTSAQRSLKGHLYGIPVYVTSNVVSGLQTYRNLLLHRSAFAFAVQNRTGSKVRVQSQYWLENLGTLTVADILYGVAVIREPGSVLINSSSAFIGS